MVANEYGGYAGDHSGRGIRGYGPRGRIPLPSYGSVPPAYDDGPLETAQVCLLPQIRLKSMSNNKCI